MSARVVCEVEPDGRVVARKRSRDDADAARLEHEADVLRSACHPGVVEFMSCEHDGATAVLTTEFVGTHSLDTLGAMSVERAAGLVAALAETLADLHDVGMVHGRIEPSHVLVAGNGRPILCGFAGGGRVATSPPPGPSAAPGFCDPAASSEATLTPQRDVYGLGCLLRWLIIDGHSDVEPIPDRRVSLARLRSSWAGFHRRALLTLCDRATDDVPSRRPPARRFADDLLQTVPGAALTDRPTPPEHVARTRTGIAKIVGFGVVTLISVLAFTAHKEGGAPASADAVATDAHQLPSTTSSTSPTTAAPVRATSTTATGCPDATPVADDLDADGCGDPVRIEDERVIVVGSRRFAAGEPGDRAAVGDWDCTGTASVAVLRPSSGAVFVFDRWATAVADVTVSPITTVPGAVELQTRDRGDGCSMLIALRSDGTEEQIA